MKHNLKHFTIFLFAVFISQLFNTPLSAEQGGKARFFLLNEERLAFSKKLYEQGDPVIYSNVVTLLGEARALLKKGPYTLADRKVPHPSGDKHNFLAFGVYYWPNPKSKDGRPWEKRDGYANPEAKRDWKLFRALTDNVEILALAYYFTGNEKFAKHATLLLRTWFIDKKTRMNPNGAYSKMIPGVREQGYAVAGFAYRFRNLYDAAGILERSVSWTGEDKKALQKWTRDFMAWVDSTPWGKEERTSPNNHTTFYYMNKTLQAMYVEDNTTARKMIEEYIRDKMPIQFEPDGTQPHEMIRANNYDYHRVNLLAAFDIAHMADHFDDIDVWNYKNPKGGGLEKSLEFLIPYFIEKKTWEHFKGKPFKQPGKARWRMFRRAALGFGDSRYEKLAEQVPGLNYLYLTELTHPYAWLERNKETGPTNASGSKRKPRTFILNQTYMERAKELLKKGDGLTRRTAKVLLKRADTLLSYKPVTVANRDFMHPSGDPRNFLSIGSYYWPNPKTKNGVPWIKRDGILNPNAKRDWKRINLMAETVRIQALAYYFSGDEKYAEHAARHLRAWFVDKDTSMHPNCNWGKMIPGVRKGGYTVAGFGYVFRQVYDAAGILEMSPHWTGADINGFREWTRRFLVWSLKSPYGIEEQRAKNNHGTFYHMISALQGMYLGNDAWALRQLRHFKYKRMRRQFSPDGSQPFEMRRANNYDYHRVNLMIAFDMAQMADRFPFIDLWNHQTKKGGSLKKSTNYLLPYLTNKKPWPYFKKKTFEISNYERWRLLHRAAAGLRDTALYKASKTIPAHRLTFYEHLTYCFGVETTKDTKDTKKKKHK